MPQTMKYSVCTGGREAVALKPQARPIFQFFAIFSKPKIISKEETTGLTDDQIKNIYKESAGYFTLGHAVQRSKDLMSDVTMIVIDGDHGVEGPLSKLETVHHFLSSSNIIHLIHSSWTEGRWRLILPLESVLAKDELEVVTRGVCAWLQDAGINIAWVKENAIISQPWFRPVICEGDSYTIHRLQVGELLDPFRFTERMSENYKRKYFNKEEAIKKILDGEELHHTTNQMIMSMIAYGLPVPEVQASVQGMLVALRHEFAEKGDASRAKEIEDRIKDLPRSITGALKKIENKNKIELPDIVADEEAEVFKLTWPPGVLGELAQLMFEKSVYPIKEVSIVSALGLIAGVGGRTYNVNRSGINLYLTLLMRTGMGKDAIQKFIAQVLGEYKGSGQSFLGAKTYTSGKALAEDLRLHRARLCVFTEAGFMYRTSSGNTESLQRNILDYYSKSGRDDFAMPERYSDSIASIQELRSPALTIINESTPEIFNQTMKHRDAVNTGERARMLAFNVNHRKPYINPNHSKFKLTPILQNKFDVFFRMCKVNQQKDTPEVLEIVPPIDYYDIINKYVDKENAAWENGSNLEATCLTRVGEKLNRLMGCLAAIESPGRPVITQEMVDWALHLIEYELATVYNFVGADSENAFYRDIVAPLIVTLLKDQGPKDTHDPQSHKRNQFSVSHLNKIFTQRKVVAQYLGHECRVEDTLMLLKYFIDLGYIYEPRAIGQKRRVCEVTPAFLEIFHTDTQS